MGSIPSLSPFPPLSLYPQQDGRGRIRVTFLTLPLTAVILEKSLCHSGLQFPQLQMELITSTLPLSGQYLKKRVLS